MNYGLPTTVTLNGVDYRVRTDFRVVLDIIEMLNDADLSDSDKAYLTLQMFYIDEPPTTKEAVEAAFEFMDMGQRSKKKSARLIDWEKDFQFIIAPVNRVLGYEARAVEYLHWWTFLAAYMEIGGDCVLSQIVSIRDKTNRGVKLEKHEQQWARKNADLINLPQKFTDKDQEMFAKWSGKGGNNNG